MLPAYGGDVTTMLCVALAFNSKGRIAKASIGMLFFMASSRFTYAMR